jgi:hypothetical protein
LNNFLKWKYIVSPQQKCDLRNVQLHFVIFVLYWDLEGNSLELSIIQNRKLLYAYLARSI